MQPIGNKKRRVAFADGPTDLADLNAMRRRLALQRGGSQPALADDNKFVSLARVRPPGSVSPTRRKPITQFYDHKSSVTFQSRSAVKSKRPPNALSSKMSAIRETCLEESVFENFSKAARSESETKTCNRSEMMAKLLESMRCDKTEMANLTRNFLSNQREMNQEMKTKLINH